MYVLIFAAHQGEEFVIILPAIMLLGAFFIMRWANQSNAEETDDSPARDDEIVFPDDLVVKSGVPTAEPTELVPRR
jgi:hypothetical protein